MRNCELFVASRPSRRRPAARSELHLGAGLNDILRLVAIAIQRAATDGQNFQALKRRDRHGNLSGRYRDMTIVLSAELSSDREPFGERELVTGEQTVLVILSERQVLPFQRQLVDDLLLPVGLGDIDRDHQLVRAVEHGDARLDINHCGTGHRLDRDGGGEEGKDEQQG